MIVGAGGAGKSTLARRVGERTGLPVVHLDACYWRAGWVETPADAWRERVRALAAEDAWVMDGNYGGSMEVRLARADTVVFLDLPRMTMIARILRRWLRYRGRTRPDMAPGCPERMSWEFVRWVWEYPRTRRPAVLARLAALPPDRRVVVLRSAAEVERWVASLEGAEVPS
jgi:adenylate kinase family enzyme